MDRDAHRRLKAEGTDPGSDFVLQLDFDVFRPDRDFPDLIEIFDF